MAAGEVPVMLSGGNVWAFVCCCVLLLPGVSPSEETLEQWRVLALAPASGQAVVRRPDGRMLLVRGGDALGTAGVRVLQVLPDRLVLEEIATAASRSPLRQQVWLYQTSAAGEAARLVRLHRALPASEQSVGTGHQAVSGPAQ